MERAQRRVLSFVTNRDRRLMRRVNGWRPPRWFRLWMVYATRAGDGWLWCALALCLLATEGTNAVRPLAAAGLASAGGVLLFMASKQIFRRQRPSAYHASCWVSLLPPDHFSFPSGHSITAFAMATPLALRYPALLPGLMFCAGSIAVSRIMLGMHFLSDVVAGIVIGVVLGYIAAAIVS